MRIRDTEHYELSIGFVAISSFHIYNFRLDIVDKLLSRGVKVTVIGQQDQYAARLIKRGCRFVDLEISGDGLNPFQDFALLLRLYKIYKEYKFDCIFQYTVKLNIYGSIAARLNGSTSVAIITGTGHTFLERGMLFHLIKFLYRCSIRYANEVWFVNQDDKDFFLEHSIISKDFKLLPGEGIDTNFYRPMHVQKNNGVTTFLFLGRILRSKGFTQYINAAKFIRKKYPNTRFLVMGHCDVDNPEAVRLKYVQSLAAEGIIEFLGATDDVRPCIAGTDCMVFPSFYGEGTPRVLLEAASMECPIITADNTGCRDIVEDGYNGFLCQPKDTENLILVIEKFLVLTKEQKIQMGHNGRLKMIDSFDQPLVTRFYLEKIGLTS